MTRKNRSIGLHDFIEEQQETIEDFLDKCRQDYNDKKVQEEVRESELYYLLHVNTIAGKSVRKDFEKFIDWMRVDRQNTLWIGISGSWRITNHEVIEDVTEVTRQIMNRGYGIITGGALGVDYLTTRVVLEEGDPENKLRIVLPLPKQLYTENFRVAERDNKIHPSQAHALINQIETIEKKYPKVLFDNIEVSHQDHDQFLSSLRLRERKYTDRNSLVSYACNGLVGFCVNDSDGVLNTLSSAKIMNKEFFLYPYDIDENGNDVIKDYDLIKIPPLLDAEEELLKMYPNLNDIIEKCKNNCNEKKSNHYSPKLYNEEAS